MRVVSCLKGSRPLRQPWLLDLGSLTAKVFLLEMRGHLLGFRQDEAFRRVIPIGNAKIDGPLQVTARVGKRTHHA